MRGWRRARARGMRSGMSRSLPLLGLGVIVVACGSRTGLLLDSLEGDGDGGGGGSGGDSSTRPVAPNGCTAALLSGAPTPMLGYCPTRAGLTNGAAPHAPAVAWSLALFPYPDPADVLPAQIVVDDEGRIYVAESSSPLAPAPGRYEIDAVDPDGSLVWRVPFESPVSNLALAADGTLWALGQVNADSGVENDAYANGVLYGLTRDGAKKATYNVTLPPHPKRACNGGGPPCPEEGPVNPFSAMAIGADSSFFVFSQAAVARVLPSGAVGWGTRIEYGYDDSLPGTLWLTPNDDILTTDGLYAATGRHLSTDCDAGLGESCDAGLASVLGSRDLLTAITPDGEIFLLTLDDQSNLSLEHVAISGEVLAHFEPGSSNETSASQLAIGADGTVLALLANEFPAPGQTMIHFTVIAVAPALEHPRWTATFDSPLQYTPFAPPNLFGLFVDPSGTVVVSGGDVIQAFDLATGATVWQLAPAHPMSCMEPAVLGAEGAVVAAQCDGSIFLARDP
jgi:outer membrane protein assembly factor BamB